MTNYYVSTARGNDSTGTGTASNPWKTINKAIGSSPAITPAAGDVLYLEPGVYRECTGMTLQPASEFQVIGDVDGSGFRAGGYATPATGVVRWTGYLSGDNAAPSTNPTCYTNSNITNHTFKNILFVGSASAREGTAISFMNGNATNIKFVACMFVGSASQSATVYFAPTSYVALNLTIDSCLIYAFYDVGFYVVGQTSASGADLNLNVVVKNSFIFAANRCVWLDSPNANTFKPGGVTLLNSTINGGSYGFTVTNNASTTVPCVAYNCVMSGPLQATSAGMILEDYNFRWITSGADSNVAQGAHTKWSAAAWADLELGQSWLWRLSAIPRPHMAPASGSFALGFGNAVSPAPPALDVMGRNRPEGGGSASNGIGYAERHDTAVQEGTTVQAGTSSWKIAGPGSQELKIAVDAVPATISIYAYADATYSTTTPPSVMLLGSGELGLAAQTVVMSPSTTGQWNLITLSSITPAKKGIVTLRLVGQPAAAGGNCYFDTLAIN